jgi:hypothetical protein
MRKYQVTLNVTLEDDETNESMICFIIDQALREHAKQLFITTWQMLKLEQHGTLE